MIDVEIVGRCYNSNMPGRLQKKKIFFPENGSVPAILVKLRSPFCHP